LVVAPLIALGAFTVYRLVRSWSTARAKLDAVDPPGSGSA
jgi:hypothetical protein